MLFLSGSFGTFLNPPYLDVHGEADPGMMYILFIRRGNPQFLFQERYEEIRRIWLSQSIPSFVAKRVEQLKDSGGWLTL